MARRAMRIAVTVLIYYTKVVFLPKIFKSERLVLVHHYVYVCICEYMLL